MFTIIIDPFVDFVCCFLLIWNGITKDKTSLRNYQMLMVEGYQNISLTTPIYKIEILGTIVPYECTVGFFWPDDPTVYPVYTY